MPIRPNTVSGLRTSDITTKVYPKLVVPPMPEKFLKAFPEMKEWLNQLQRADDERTQKWALVSNGGTS